MSVASQIEYFRSVLPPQVSLVAVSKFKPSSAVAEAYSAGQRVFGESRPKEMMEKAMMLPSDIEWHFIGHLQTNKIRMVVPYVSMIESVDSLRLLEAIDNFAGSLGKVVDCLLEVHIASEESKQGFAMDEIPAVVNDTVRYPNVNLRGLMGMASNTCDEAVVRGEFRLLRALFDNVRDSALKSGSPQLGLRLRGFDTLSMGMSNDWHLAVEEGSTAVRIGTAIFGQRS